MSMSTHCQACGQEAPTKYVEFYQNIGAIFIRFQRGIRGRLCKSCIHANFWKYTGLTLLTGWWGIVSFFMNWFFLFNNIGRYIACLGMPSHYTQENYPG
ncbi:MAG TPA: hypothetical protein VMS17_25015 [Gemmataceae bacterium]|nr:hypothetical protein [Gemmataceae bacterium]